MGQALERRYMAEPTTEVATIDRSMAELPITGMKDQSNSPEAVGISIKEAESSDLPILEEFLARPDIDGLFSPSLSDPVRGITIRDRVQKKFHEGVWVVAVHEGKVVGCMAVVPSRLSIDVPVPDPDRGIKASEGVSFSGWQADKIMELSTVVTDPKIKEALKVKGMGTELLDKAKDWTKRKGEGKWALVTDSWVGGGMGEFIAKLNTRAYLDWCKQSNQEPALDENGHLNTIVRVYSDPGKRGENGPATVVYGIPIDNKDWEYHVQNQDGIRQTQGVYDKLNQSQMS